MNNHLLPSRTRVSNKCKARGQSLVPSLELATMASIGGVKPDIAGAPNLPLAFPTALATPTVSCWAAHAASRCWRRALARRESSAPCALALASESSRARHRAVGPVALAMRQAGAVHVLAGCGPSAIGGHLACACTCATLYRFASCSKSIVKSPRKMRTT